MKTKFLRCPDFPCFVSYARKLVVNKVVPVTETGKMTIRQFYDLSPQKVKDNIDRWISEGTLKFEMEFEIRKLEKKSRPRKEEKKEEKKVEEIAQIIDSTL